MNVEESDNPVELSAVRLRLALRAANIGIWDWDLVANSFAYSSRARAIYGFGETEEITLDMVKCVTHPLDLPYTSAQARRALNPDILEDRPFEYRIIRADTGELRWVRAEGQAIVATVDGIRRSVRYIGIVQDITEQKKVAVALEESERRQRLAIEAAGMAVWEVDLATDVLTNSAELNRIFGFPEDGKPTIEDFRGCYLPGEREKTREAALKAIAAGSRHFEVEFRILRRDGQPRWLLLRGEILSSATGEFERVVGVVMDIDDQKQNAARQLIMMRELNHRVKNSLSVVQSIASQTFRSGATIEDALSSFNGRLKALADANDVLLTNRWSDFSFRLLLERILAPYRGSGSDPFTITGEDLDIPPRYNVSLALTLHELATNAAKYGALSVIEGRVIITCGRNEGILSITWEERNGPVVQPPDRAGFGTKLLARILAREFEVLELRMLPGGVHCRIVIRDES